MFAHQVEGLRDQFRVIVYDHRGHGESEKPRHGYRVARLAKDLDDHRAVVGSLPALFRTGASTDADWLVGEMLKLPAATASALMFGHPFNDWRAVIPRITIPDLADLRRSLAEGG
jgi:alpha-beta hydrolase superfamily lysophospholipase